MIHDIILFAVLITQVTGWLIMAKKGKIITFKPVTDSFVSDS